MIGKISQTNMTALSKDIGNILSFSYNQFVTSIEQLKEYYKLKKVKTIFIAIISIFCLGITSFYCFSTILSPIKINAIKQVHVLPRGGIISGLFNDGILGIFTNSIHLLSPVLDGFVGNTPDVTGFSNNNQIAFADGGFIQTTESFYNKSFSVALVLLVFLFVVVGVKFITDTEGNIESKSALRELLQRFLWIAVFLLAGRMILSLSIQTINAMNNFFQEGTSISTFINTFANNLTNTDQGTILSSSIFSIFVFALILVLFFVISLQFIVRFVSLYFLAVIQPLSCIFLLLKETSGIHENFWKNWFTLLIHQPFFILGFALMESILVGSLKGNISLTSLLILLAILLFLTTINVFVSHIFTDVWLATHSNQRAAIGRGLLMGAGGFVAGVGSRGIAKFAKRNFSETGKKQTYFYPDPSAPALDAGMFSRRQTETGKPQQNDTKKNSSAKAYKKTHADLLDPLKSIYAKKIQQEGSSISRITGNDKVLGISGNYFASSQGNGISTLYSSKENAFADGVDSVNLRQVSIDSLPILDTSNYTAKQDYNSRIVSTAKAKGVSTKDLHLTSTSSPNRIIEGMKIGKAGNLTNQIHGVAVERMPNIRNPKGESSSRQIQIYAYDDYLNFRK